MSFKARRITLGAEVQPYQWASVEHLEALTATVHARLAAEAGPDDPPRDLSAIERDAFAKGYAQGERAGVEAASTRTEAMLRRMSETIEELAGLRADMIRRTERQMVQLALAIAARILHREISLDRGLLAGMARVALDRLGANTSATIRLNPDDHAVVVAAQAEPPTGEQIQIVADPQVRRGGCLVQSEFGFMDASVDGQIQELARTLFDDAEPQAGDSAAAAASEVHAYIAK